jgi:integrase
MNKYHAENERMKRRYFRYLKEAKRLSEESVDAAAKSLARFEEYNQHKDFKAYHFEQAIAFKKYLTSQRNQRSGENLSKATLNATMNNLKLFFQWLSDKPGYKSRFQYSDADYFSLSKNDVAIATAKREKKFPTLEQVKHVIAMMPAQTDIERRDRALVAFTLLTAARVNAIASAKLKHIDLQASCFNQDARGVHTKFGKTFATTFFPVGDDIRAIVADWVTYLREVKLWGNDDPLFPATRIVNGQSRQFEEAGLKRECWGSTSSIRSIFREAFTAAGQEYFNPHSFRDTLAQYGEQICTTPEEFKAWSQNLGHEKVMTTFFNYGNVEMHRQKEIIRGLAKPVIAGNIQPSAIEIAKAVIHEMQKANECTQ